MATQPHRAGVPGAPKLPGAALPGAPLETIATMKESVGDSATTFCRTMRVETPSVDPATTTVPSDLKPTVKSPLADIATISRQSETSHCPRLSDPPATTVSYNFAQSVRCEHVTYTRSRILYCLCIPRCNGAVLAVKRNAVFKDGLISHLV